MRAERQTYQRQVRDVMRYWLPRMLWARLDNLTAKQRASLVAADDDLDHVTFGEA